MSGHVFILRGDVTNLACDHWLLPTDRHFMVEPGWHRAVKTPEHLREPGGALRLADGWPPGSRVRRFSELSADGHAPRPWLVDVGSVAGERASWFAEGAAEFLRAASAATPPGAALFERVRPLLALPLVGTGAGGASGIKGDVLESLMRALLDAPPDVDVALVTRSAAALAAAQAVRRRLAPNTRLWAEVEALREDAAVLARQATSGRLVVFLGAGVSKASGKPLWKPLLQELSEEASLTEAERKQFDDLDVLDRAKVLEARLGGREGLAERIIERFRGGRPSLSHHLLAGLPVTEAATTNYDRLFEAAAEAAGRPRAVLPGEDVSSRGGPWLLKLHGSIERPADIVLTRDDYLSYGERRAALAGIVQALLITRHMLFVGFGLDDDNLHRILHDVRNAIGDAGSRPQGPTFGTVVALEDKPLAQDLWRGDLRSLNLESESRPAAARRLEIFLDLLLDEASSASPHLLDESYASVLDPGERRLADVLRGLAKALADGDLVGTPAAAAAVDLVRRYGGTLADEPEARAAPVSDAKGSRRRMQELVQWRQAEVLQRFAQEWPSLHEFARGRVRWLSPVPEDGYRELRDDLWVRANLPSPTPQADDFWPRRGPVWDGVATATGPGGDRGVVLVEAKSHAGELQSGGSAASGDALKTITGSLDAAKAHLGVPRETDWSGAYYQLANRLTYLYYLRVVRRIPAWLLLVYFVGDRFTSGTKEVVGPEHPAGWREPIQAAERALGLPAEHPLSPYVHKLFLQVG